jgi:hypothetical protein
LKRADAKREAVGHCIAQWLALNPPFIPEPFLCIHCNAPTAKTDLALALNDGGRNAWVHQRCHEPFRLAQRISAASALARFGIGAGLADPSTSIGSPARDV